jgi:hypothetical protein
VEELMRPSERRLCHAIQALAQPADVQRALFPEFAAAGDELAIEFDEALKDFESHGTAPSLVQAEAIRELDVYLEALSGPAHSDFWDDLGDCRWERVRSLAASILVAFDWSNERPPKDGSVYVSGEEVVRNA